MKYRYSGPVSGVTLDTGEEVMLHPGSEVELAESHDYTQTLVALWHLVPIVTPQAKGKKGETDAR